MKIKKGFYKLTHWETWNYLAKYIPIMPVWLWYCCRARSLWFFTPSNPTISFGGFEGEGKKEMYSQLPPGTFPKSIYIHPDITAEEAKDYVFANNFNYPFAVKPNVGMMGFMFRKINNEQEFLRYHQHMAVEYIVQEFVDFPVEVSVFYYRFPNHKKGHISGFLKKEFLQVVGDGKSTLLQLIEAYPSVQFRLPEMRSKHVDKLGAIIPSDKIYFLSYALNLSRGGKLVSLAHQNDQALVQQFDKISNYTKDFYYGRYDIKCASVEDLNRVKIFPFSSTMAVVLSPIIFMVTAIVCYRHTRSYWRIGKYCIKYPVIITIMVFQHGHLKKAGYF